MYYRHVLKTSEVARQRRMKAKLCSLINMLVDEYLIVFKFVEFMDWQQFNCIHTQLLKVVKLLNEPIVCPWTCFRLHISSFQSAFCINNSDTIYSTRRKRVYAVTNSLQCWISVYTDLQLAFK